MESQKMGPCVPLLQGGDAQSRPFNFSKLVHSFGLYKLMKDPH